MGNYEYKLIKKRGFTLIELILVLSISSAITFMSFNKFLRDHEINQANNAGEQLKQVGNAVNSYVSVKYDKLSSLANAAGTTADPGPRTCVAATNTCTISVQTLINEGILPSTYKGLNIFNAGYDITLKRNGTAPYYNINGLVITTKPWLGAENRIRYDLLGQAMQLAGIDSGVTNNSTSTVSGYNGNWSQSTTTFNNINQAGQLAYQVGYGSFSYSIYLRRDGTLPMTGDLNLGTNNITNAKNIAATGNVTVGGTATITGLTTIGGDAIIAGNVSSKNFNATGNAVITGKTTTGSMVVNNDLTWGSFSTKGSLDTFGNLTTSQGTFDFVNSKNVTATQQMTTKFLTGQYLNISGEIQVPKLTMNAPASGGEAQFFNTGTSYLHKIYMGPNEGASITNYGSLYTGEDATFAGNAKVSKDLNVMGTSNIANLSSSGNITAYGVVQGAYLAPSSSVTIGQACANNGYISKDSFGAIVSCKNSVWREVGGSKLSGMYMIQENSLNYNFPTTVCLVKNGATGDCSCAYATSPSTVILETSGDASNLTRIKFIGCQ